MNEIYLLLTIYDHILPTIFCALGEYEMDHTVELLQKIHYILYRKPLLLKISFSVPHPYICMAIKTSKYIEGTLKCCSRLSSLRILKGSTAL